jgi:Domain of unknown function (DUF4332)
MKLTDIALHSLSTRRNLHLQRLSQGLNVVFGSASTCRDIISGITELLFGPVSSASFRNVSENSYLAIQSGSAHYRLQRASHVSSSPTLNTLVMTDLATGHASHRQPDWLSSIDRPLWESIFDVTVGNVPAMDETGLIDFLVGRLQIAPGNGSPSTLPFPPDINSFQAWRAGATERRMRLETLLRDAEAIRKQREELLASINRLDSTRRGKLAGIESGLSAVQTTIDSFDARIREYRAQLTAVESEMARLAAWIENEERAARSAPVAAAGFNYLEVYYARLDDLEMQIRRWRGVQNEVQQQRLKLKDELTSANELAIESREHPYHDAREILMALENKVNRTDNLARSWEKTASPALNTLELATLCQEMRGDLGALCSELSRQYRHVRHRAAVAELKQLRRCYHDMEENIQRLVAHRVEIVAAIRDVDPAGAAAIERIDVSFATCAGQEGYFAARQRFVNHPLPDRHAFVASLQTVLPDLAAERSRLADLGVQRNALVENISAMEHEIATQESRRRELLRLHHECQPESGAEITGRLASLDHHLNSLDSERTALEIRVREDARYMDWKPDYLMTDACRYLARLTAGQWSQMGIAAGRLVLVDATGSSRTEQEVSPVDRSLARLALRLAAIGQLALRGIRLPLLVTDLRSDNAGQLVHDTLDAFCRHGHQAILFTGASLIAQTARSCGQAVYELADTDIVTPNWPSDHSFGTAVSRLPRSEFPEVPVITTRTNPLAVVSDLAAPVNPVRTETPLAGTDVVESIYLNALDSLGVRTIRELIALDLEGFSTELVRRGFTVDQVRRWQSQALLLIAVPEIPPQATRVLVACGIDDPDMLEQHDLTALADRIRRYLESPSGRGASVSGVDFSAPQLRSWGDRIRSSASWRGLRRPTANRRGGYGSPSSSPPRFGGSGDFTRDHGAQSAPFSHRASAAAPSRTEERATHEPRNERIQFSLQLNDKLEAAPSIGPKSAIKFEEIGVFTVADFLGAEATAMASRLANRRMSANVIKSWQDQTRLVCSVPNLRGHDAQLLVGCNITDAGQLARMEPQELLSLVLPFSRSKEGERIIRHGKRPDLAEVAGWIEAASRHSRPIRAA